MNHLLWKQRIQFCLEGKENIEKTAVKELLEAKYSLIKTKGKAKVDSVLEKEYDNNNDGILDSDEAEALKEDLKPKP